MVITELRRRRGQLYLLFLDGEEAVTVDVRTFDESPYCLHGEITDEQLRELLMLSCRNRTRERALYLLSIKDYPRRELEKKLLTVADADTAASAVRRLEDVGLVDDVRYAGRLARDLCQYKQYPKRRIALELQRKGIDRETAENAAEETDAEDFKQALALIEKKYYNKMSDVDARQKVIGALARYGFPYRAIRQAMERYDEEKESDCEE